MASEDKDRVRITIVSSTEPYTNLIYEVIDNVLTFVRKEIREK